MSHQRIVSRAPTPSELAAELKIDFEELSDGLVAGNAYQTVSVESTIGNKTDELQYFEKVLAIESNSKALARF